MKKIITVFIVMATIMLCGALSASAKTMDMYINGMYSTQEVEQIGGFDMLPAEEVSGYFGFTSYFDGYTLTFYGTERTYYFHIGDAVVTDNAGGWYGLDITPRLINNTVYIPAKFFCDTFGMPYTWDWVTETIFINSDYTYNWLINTYEYRVGRYNKIKKIRTQAYIDIAKESLSVPNDSDIKCNISDIDDPSYWEAAGIYLISVSFWYKGELMATAMVNAQTGLPERNISGFDMEYYNELK